MASPLSAGRHSGLLGRAPAPRQRPVRPSWSRLRRPTNLERVHDDVAPPAARALGLPAWSLASRISTCNVGLLMRTFTWTQSSVDQDEILYGRTDRFGMAVQRGLFAKLTSSRRRPRSNR